MNRFYKYFNYYYDLVQKGCIFRFNINDKLAIIKTDELSDMENIYISIIIAKYITK